MNTAIESNRYEVGKYEQTDLNVKGFELMNVEMRNLPWLSVGRTGNERFLFNGEDGLKGEYESRLVASKTGVSKSNQK